MSYPAVPCGELPGASGRLTGVEAGAAPEGAATGWTSDAMCSQPPCKDSPPLGHPGNGLLGFPRIWEGGLHPGGNPG